MAVLLNRRFFIAILLVAIYETKVIRYICVMILVNFFNYFIGWSGDHCRAKNIFFLFVTNKINIGCCSCHSTEYSMLHRTFIHFLLLIPVIVIISLSDILFLYTQEKPKVQCSLKQLNASSNIYTFRYIVNHIAIV